MLVSMMKSWLKLGMKDCWKTSDDIEMLASQKIEALSCSSCVTVGKATTTVVKFSSLGNYPRAAPHLLQLLDPAGGSFAI